MFYLASNHFLFSSRNLSSGIHHVPVKFSPILSSRLGNSHTGMSEIIEVTSLRKTSLVKWISNGELLK